MSGFSQDQKIALLVVPMLLFGVLGLGGVGSVRLDGDGIEARKGHVYGSREVKQTLGAELRNALSLKRYDLFVSALKETPYALYADHAVFDALVHAYELQIQGRGMEAENDFVRLLYG